MNFLKTTSTLSLFAILAACGTNNGGPASNEIGTNTAGLTASYDSGMNTVVVTDGDVTFVYGVDPSGDAGAINGHLRQTPAWTDYALYGMTPSGEGVVFLVNSTEDGYEASFAHAARLGSTSIPESGSATFEGDYSGVYFRSIGNDDVWYFNLTGEVRLVADFEKSEISGSIFSRSVGATIAMDDITLANTSISGGAFSGTTSGGSGSGYTASAGTYGGLITGADAGEVVGSVYLPVIRGTDDGIEVGVFVATEVD